MNNIMGQYLGVKDKAKFNQVSKNLKINYSEKDKNKVFYRKLVNITEKYRNETNFSFIQALDNINATNNNLTVVNNVVTRYWKKYRETQKKQGKKIIKYIKDKKINKNVEDYLIKYFTDTDNGYYELTSYEYDDYEDYDSDFWDITGYNVNIYTSATREVRNDIKDIPNVIDKYFNTIIELVDLYVKIIGDKIVELPLSINQPLYEDNN